METKLLIVDDDKDVLRAARIALIPHFGRIELADSPGEIESLVRDCSWDAILLDMNFALGEYHGTAGLSALNKIHLVDPLVSVVLMTSYGSVSLAVDVLKQGAVDFILKPWRNDKLVEIVKAAAELTRVRRGSATLNLDTMERKTIEMALLLHQRNISNAAHALGVSRASLYRRIAKYGL